MFKRLPAAAAALLLSAAAASATPVQTLTFGGTLAYGYESSGLFAAPNSQLGGKSFSITLSFDPTALTSNTCGSGANTSCMWNFGAGGITQTVTIAGNTKQFAATSGNIQYNVSGGDKIYLNAYGAGGLYFGGQFLDSNQLFSSHSNANNPLLLVDFVNAALSGGSQFQSSGLGPDHNTSFGANLTKLSASYASGAPARVPEASSLALLVAALSLLLFARRGQAARIG